VSSEGYSKLSLSKALRRYISLPIAFDQLAQLVPGLGGDTIPGPNNPQQQQKGKNIKKVNINIATLNMNGAMSHESPFLINGVR
jgi:hypothetical protein